MTLSLAGGVGSQNTRWLYPRVSAFDSTGLLFQMLALLLRTPDEFSLSIFDTHAATFVYSTVHAL
jgi:hypothetical protein